MIKTAEHFNVSVGHFYVFFFVKCLFKSIAHLDGTICFLITELVGVLVYPGHNL